LEDFRFVEWSRTEWPGSLSILGALFRAYCIMEKNKEIDELSRRLSKMKTQEERLDLLVEMSLRSQTKPPKTIRLGDPEGHGSNRSRDKKPTPLDNDALAHTLAKRYDLEIPLAEHLGKKMLEGMLPSEDPWSGPILSMPCANVDPDMHERCSKVGTLACAGCRLVLYCSTVCNLLFRTKI
jgi:hypothetical protein